MRYLSCSVLGLLWLLTASWENLQAQVCCAAPPTAQSSTNGGADRTYGSVTDFVVTLSGGSGNFIGWTVGEYSPYAGADSCWNAKVNPSFVPEYPIVTGTSGQANGSNHIVDQVGWLPASVNYVRANSPLHSRTPIIPNFPCGSQIYQGLWIECPQSSSPVDFPAGAPPIIQSETINSTSVQNCRQGVCPTISF